MKSILIKALLINIFITCILCSDEKSNFYDSVNARKDFFFNNLNWNKYLNKKIYLDSNNIGFICIYDLPVTITKSNFENELINSITNEIDKKIISSNYILNTKKYLYVLNDYISNDDIKNIKDILKSIKFIGYDYFMVFYNINKALDKKNEIQDTEYLSDSFTYGRISYQFNYKKELVEVKVYYHDNNNSYLQFNNFNPGKYDVYLFGKLMRKGLPYYFSFESLKYLSITSILSLLDKNNIKNETRIADNDYDLKQKFIDKIITPSLELEYNEDGAKDEFGNFIYISNEELQTGKKGVNCSGFVKDIADNYIRLEKKEFKWLSVSELKIKRTYEREDNPFNYLENKYDQFFGLDWAKNIADKINNYYGYKIIKAEILNNDENVQYFDPNGYTVNDLKEILFRDQNKNSLYFYILAFNKLRTTPPPIPVFYHIAVAVPYFKDNHFYIRTFESADETDLAKMLNIHVDEKVVIIKIPIPYIQLLD